MIIAGNNKLIEKQCGWQRRHADIDFKRLWPRQPAQALPDLRKARLVLLLCGISRPLLANLFSIFSQPQNNRWKTPICLLLVPFQRRFSQYKFAVGSISPQVEEQSAPEL